MNKYIKSLVDYGVDCGLIEKEDVIYTTNMMLEALKLETYEEPSDVKKISTPEDLEEVLKAFTDYAVEKGLIEDTNVHRDLFDTKIMNILVPKPSQVIKTFWNEYNNSPKAATDYYYNLSKATDYIRTYRVKKDKKWVVDTEYGKLDITINLSKPEKDPKAIASLKNMKASSYPKCQLCIENEGYAGRVDHPARENHRIIPITINGAKWGFQYSPYVYYNEHCIVFAGEHTPMKMCRETFVKLFDFIDLFPHYIIGSNADLPIVGGSILTHDHFQGGNYNFPMAKAPVEKEYVINGYEDISVGRVKWPMSVIRLSGTDRERIIELSGKILDTWRGYSDEEVFIYANTEGEDHNTITPIARMRDGKYEIDLVLRNNITTKEHPLGVYHPWEELHHIKKENIGLIEVMGLAVLPARLDKELKALKEAILKGDDYRTDEVLCKHADWADSLKDKYEFTKENIDEIINEETGLVFKQVLECAGVFKRDEAGKTAFDKFLAKLM